MPWRTEHDNVRLMDLILHILADSDVSASKLKELLEEQGFRMSAQYFFQIMSNLVADGIVDSRERPVKIAGLTLKERRYRLPVNGNK